jgi:hypothetical protein
MHVSGTDARGMPRITLLSARGKSPRYLDEGVNGTGCQDKYCGHLPDTLGSVRRSVSEGRLFAVVIDKNVATNTRRTQMLTII